jgi:ribosome-binding protein aMBF1 (putative translation factor)
VLGASITKRLMAAGAWGSGPWPTGCSYREKLFKIQLSRESLLSLPMAKAKPRQLRQLLAKNIRRLRHELGISQEELAFRARVHRTYMSSIERAHRNVAIVSIEKIAKALDVKPHQLLLDERR